MGNFNTDKIILALSLHGQDDSLLDYTEFLNRQFDFNEITAIHVLAATAPVFEAETEQVSTAYKVQSDYEEQLEESIEDYLSSRCGQAERFLVKFGNIEEEILKTANAEQAQLLLFGQKNDKLLHALSAEKVVRNSKTNLLLIPNGAQPIIRKILVPIDFSEASIHALKKAIAFNNQLKSPAKITVLHVTGNEDFPSIDLCSSTGKFQKLREESRSDFLKIIIKKHLPEEIGKFKIKVVARKENTPAETITAYAKDKNFDFVVMGARGEGVLSTLLFGSTTEGVVKEISNIPVMIIKDLAIKIE